ncbi:MAG TPA: hypothetical protein VM509_15150 [Planctomycetota bacterium]|nr:hypothetical protein [Planctomycetota bacterium]
MVTTTQIKERSYTGPRIIFGNWGAIVAAAFAGLGVSIVMMTLGMAIGVTAGASADSGVEASEAAKGFGMGMGLWILISAVVVGIVAGRVLFRTSSLERPAMSALVTWALGLGLAALLAAISGGGLLAGLGGATSGAVQARSQVSDYDRTSPSASAEQAAAAEKAKDAAKGVAAAAWFALLAQLVGLGTTVLVANKGHRKVEERERTSQTTTQTYAPA